MKLIKKCVNDNHNLVVGRVVLIKSGPRSGRLAVIVNDSCRSPKSLITIDGPNYGVIRHKINRIRVQATEFILDIAKDIKRQDLKKTIEDYDLDTKWAESDIGKNTKLKKR